MNQYNQSYQYLDVGDLDITSAMHLLTIPAGWGVEWQGNGIMIPSDRFNEVLNHLSRGD